MIITNLIVANSEVGQVCGGRHLKPPGEVEEPGMRPFYAIAAQSILATFPVWQIVLYIIIYAIFFFLARRSDDLEDYDSEEGEDEQEEMDEDGLIGTGVSVSEELKENLIGTQGRSTVEADSGDDDEGENDEENGE